MGSGLIEVGDVGLEDPGEVLLVQDEQVIETFTTHASQKAFTVRVGARSAVRCSQQLNRSSAGHPVKELAELGIVVMDQESGCLSIGRCLPELL